MSTQPMTPREKFKEAQQAFLSLSPLHRGMTGPVIVPLLNVIESLVEEIERMKNAATS